MRALPTARGALRCTFIDKDGYTPGAETNAGYGFDVKNANASVVGAADLSLTGNVAFTLEPGVSF